MPKPQIEDGYTRIANELLGEMVKLHLSGNEWSIVHCVMRKTWGWNKKEDCISLSQFEKETGLPRPTVNKNIKSLVAKRLLVAKLLPSGNIYQIQKDYSLWDSSNNNTSSKIATTLVAKSPLKLVAKLLPTKETTKETIQKKHLPTEKDFNKLDIEAISEEYQVRESFVLSKWDDILNYCLSNNKKYSDFNRTLRSWVKKDAIKLNQEAHGKSNIGFIKTE